MRKKVVMLAMGSQLCHHWFRWALVEVGSDIAFGMPAFYDVGLPDAQ